MRVTIAVLSLIIFCVPAGALENNISRALFYHLGLLQDVPGIPALIDSSYRTGRTLAAVGTGYNDVLHYDDETGVEAGIDAFTITGNAVYPLPEKGTALLYAMNLGYLSAALARSNDYVSAAPESPSAYVRFGTMLDDFFGTARALFTGGYGYTRSSGRLHIKAWPSADEPNLNTYLFDLLEPTFGNEQDYTYFRVDRTAQAVLEYGPVFLQGDILRNTGELQASYENTDPLGMLDGDKDASFTTKTYGLDLTAGSRFTVRAKLTGMTGIRYGTWNGTLDIVPQNPTPGTSDSVAYLDKTDWGGGDLSRKTKAIFARLSVPLYNRHRICLDAQAGISDIRGSGELVTPVLGWELSLPISHSFAGKLRADMITQYYRLTWEGRIGPTLRAGAAAGWAHADMDIFIDGQAGIEFNIVTTPVDADYEYNVDVYSVAGNIARKMSDRWELELRLEETVPVADKVKEVQHTGPAPQPGPGMEKHVRGGMDIRVISRWTI